MHESLERVQARTRAAYNKWGVKLRPRRDEKQVPDWPLHRTKRQPAGVGMATREAPQSLESGEPEQLLLHQSHVEQLRNLSHTLLNCSVDSCTYVTKRWLRFRCVSRGLGSSISQWRLSIFYTFPIRTGQQNSVCWTCLIHTGHFC